MTKTAEQRETEERASLTNALEKSHDERTDIKARIDTRTRTLANVAAVAHAAWGAGSRTAADQLLGDATRLIEDTQADLVALNDIEDAIDEMRERLSGIAAQQERALHAELAQRAQEDAETGADA